MVVRWGAAKEATTGDNNGIDSCKPARIAVLLKPLTLQRRIIRARFCLVVDTAAAVLTRIIGVTTTGGTAERRRHATPSRCDDWHRAAANRTPSAAASAPAAAATWRILSSRKSATLYRQIPVTSNSILRQFVYHHRHLFAHKSTVMTSNKIRETEQDSKAHWGSNSSLKTTNTINWSTWMQVEN